MRKVVKRIDEGISAVFDKMIQSWGILATWVTTMVLLMGVIFVLSLIFPNGPTAHAATTPGIPWTCSVDNIGATLTLCKDGVPPGYKLYITDLVAQSTTATAGQMLLRYGTGTNCGTGTTSVLPSGATAARLAYAGSGSAPTHLRLATPLSVPAAKDLCIIGTATNTVTAQIIGEIRP
jgi:hypothetical protein